MRLNADYAKSGGIGNSDIFLPLDADNPWTSSEVVGTEDVEQYSFSGQVDVDLGGVPKDELLKDFSTVVELALGLVLLTVVGVGFFIHWMIPAIPLPVAFALAAVVSPTDPIAVSAIAKRAPIPKRMMHILEGESLLNDASGLVCLRFAVAATMTASFSATEALMSFLWVASGGIAVGIVVTLAVTRAKGAVRRTAPFGKGSGIGRRNAPSPQAR